jgi:hypothetical protein
MADADYPTVLRRPSTPQARAVSPGKRQRVAPDPFVDADATPRNRFNMLPPPPPPSAFASGRSSRSRSSTGHSSPTKASDRSSHASGRGSKPASPVKNLAPFVLGPTSIETQGFDSRDSKAAMPAALKLMLKKIDRFSKGYYVASNKMRVSHKPPIVAFSSCTLALIVLAFLSLTVLTTSLRV